MTPRPNILVAKSAIKIQQSAKYPKLPTFWRMYWKSAVWLSEDSLKDFHPGGKNTKPYTPNKWEICSYSIPKNTVWISNLTQSNETQWNHQKRCEVQLSSAKLFYCQQLKNASYHRNDTTNNSDQIWIDWCSNCIQYLNNVRLPRIYSGKLTEKLYAKYQNARLENAFATELFEFITKCWFWMIAFDRLLGTGATSVCWITVVL